MAAVKKRKKIRRSKRRKPNYSKNNEDLMKNDNKWMLFHLNIRGFQSKCVSFDAIMEQLKPNCITLNETCLRNRRKIKISKYKSFTRNRCNGKIMGGISTSVIENEKNYVVQTKEGKDEDEFIVTRHSNFFQPINIINIYGEQEGRETKANVENRWFRILEEIIKIENRNEMCILIGDFNKHIGNGENGVEGNHSKTTFGGELILNFLSDGRYICLNNHKDATGGPFTRYVQQTRPIRRKCLAST